MQTAILCLPILIPMAAALALLVLRHTLAAVQRRLACVATAATLAAALLCLAHLLTRGGASLQWAFFGATGLHLRLDGFRAVFLILSALLWLISTLYSGEYLASEDGLARYHCFSLLTLGATMGVFLSADFAATFLFFELMSLASYPLVTHSRTPEAMGAGETYLAVAVIGGMSMSMGLFLLYSRFGTLDFDALYQAARAAHDPSALYLPGVLLLVGFGAKAGMFPLHIWLPGAYKEAPAPATALLSGVLSKTGVYGILAVTVTLFVHDIHWGLLLLLPAMVTMVWGGVLALLSIDMKGTLAFSSMSQLGFILLGCAMLGLLGEHNALAVRGTILHMINHALLKLVLFLLAGAVYRHLGTTRLNDIRGLGRGRPLFLFLFSMAALGTAGVPLWNGYISKTLLHESIVEAVPLYRGEPLAGVLQWTESLFLFAGGLTVAYLLKLFVVLFLERPQDDAAALKTPYLSHGSAAALTAIALLLPVLGVVTPIMDTVAALSEPFLHGHPPDHTVHYFTWENLRGALVSMAIGIVLHSLTRRLLLREGRYVDRLPRWANLETAFYRPLLRAVTAAGVLVARVAETLPDAIFRKLLSTFLRQSRPKDEVSSFYARFYWLFHPRVDRPRREPVLTGTLTYGLLLLGIGLSILLLYVFLGAILPL